MTGIETVTEDAFSIDSDYRNVLEDAAFKVWEFYCECFTIKRDGTFNCTDDFALIDGETFAIK